MIRPLYHGQYTVHVTLLCTKSFGSGVGSYGKNQQRKMCVQTEFYGVFLFKTNNTIPSPSVPNYSHICVEIDFINNMFFSELLYFLRYTSQLNLHCREEGCIGLYIPDNQEMSRGQSPSDISRADGNFQVGRDVHCTLYNPKHPDLRQCKAIL